MVEELTVEMNYYNGRPLQDGFTAWRWYYFVDGRGLKKRKKAPAMVAINISVSMREYHAPEILDVDREQALKKFGRPLPHLWLKGKNGKLVWMTDKQLKWHKRWKRLWNMLMR
jgi:hypothetical protein